MTMRTYTDDIIGATVTVIPAGMNGYAYRKRLGIPEHWMGVKKGFRVRAKFRGIKVKDRLAFLRKMSKVVRKKLNHQQILSERGQFNKFKFTNFPIGEKQMCYCCTERPAQLRHHVIALANGGRHKENNIVPLCKHCHSLIHPHLRGPKGKRKLEGAVASRHSVFPKINGPVVVNPEGVIVSDTAKACVTAPRQGVPRLLDHED